MSAPARPAYINCEQCRHFSGSSFWLRFGCAKGHTDQDEDHASGMLRKACADFNRATRAELIFMRQKSVFNGGDAMKQDSITVKRTATTLRRLIAEHALGRYLTSDQIEHFKVTIAALDALAPDLTRAAKLADRYRDEEIAAMQYRRDDAMVTLCTTSVEATSFEGLTLVAEDLLLFVRRWQSVPNPRGEVFRAYLEPYECNPLMHAIDIYKARPTPASLRGAQVVLGELIEQLKMNDRGRNTGRWTDFVEYRKYCKVQRQMLAGAAGSGLADDDTGEE